MWQLNSHKKRMLLLFANELQSRLSLALALSPVSSAHAISHTFKGMLQLCEHCVPLLSLHCLLYSLARCEHKLFCGALW